MEAQETDYVENTGLSSFSLLILRQSLYIVSLWLAPVILMSHPGCSVLLIERQILPENYQLHREILILAGYSGAHLPSQHLGNIYASETYP